MLQYPAGAGVAEDFGGSLAMRPGRLSGGVAMIAIDVGGLGEGDET